MSNTLKFVLVLIAILAVGGLYILKQNEAQFTAKLSPHQTLDTMINTGDVEVKSFKDWCRSQGHQGEELSACVKKREAKAKKLLELEKQAKEKTEDATKLPKEGDSSSGDVEKELHPKPSE